MTVHCEPTLPLGANRAITIKVARWENAEPTIGFGKGFGFDPYRKKLPVVTITDADRPSPYLVPIPYDWTEAHPFGPDFRSRGDGEIVASGNFHTIEENILAQVAPVPWRPWRARSGGISPDDYDRRRLKAKTVGRLRYLRAVRARLLSTLRSSPAHALEGTPTTTEDTPAAPDHLTEDSP